MPPYKQIVFVTLAVACLHPILGPVMALIAGMAVSLIMGNPYPEQTKSLPKTLLAISIIGLGAGMNLIDVLEAGASGFLYTAIGITATLGLGYALMRAFKIERESGILIGIGTAICGGSAIAAAAPAINAKPSAIAISLAVVFALNALALLIFPPIGNALNLTQHQFGLWSALAIHDTSSVVGAGMKYGQEALTTATSVKLARALWVIPVVLVIQSLWQNDAQKSEAKKKFPWFILGFLAMAAIVTYIPALSSIGETIAFCARRLLVLTLFLIGVNINLEMIKSSGIKPFAFGIALWLIVATLSLAAISLNLIE